MPARAGAQPRRSTVGTLAATAALAVLTGSLVTLAPAARADTAAPSPRPAAGSARAAVPAPGAPAAPAAAAASPSATTPAPVPLPVSPKAAPEPALRYGVESGQGCGTDPRSWGWLPNGTPAALTATVPGPTPGLVVEFHVRDVATPDTDLLSGPATTVSDKGVASFPLDDSRLLNGHAYVWHAVTRESADRVSEPTAGCHFRIDRTAPQLTIPEFASWSAAQQDSGWMASYRFTDAAPLDGFGSYTSCYEYRVNDSPVWAAPQCDAADYGTARLSFPGPGLNTIHLRGIDHAGNRSAEAVRTTFVYPGTATAARLQEPSAHWLLNRPAGGAETLGKSPLTATGTVGWTDGSASFGGTGSLGSTQPVIDTTKSFSVNLAARAAVGGGVVASQDGNRSSGFILWANPTDNNWHFSLGAADDDYANWDDTTIRGAGFTPAVKYGTWQRLTASYNATSGAISLYVDGQLTASGNHDPKKVWKANGPLRIGQYQFQGHADFRFKGEVADVAVFNRTTGHPTEEGRFRNSLYGVGPYSGACMAVDPGDQSALGSRARFLNCDYTNLQGFTAFSADGTVRQNGKCLDLAYGQTVNGTAIQLWDCNGGANQIWQTRADGSLYNPLSGRCVDLPFGDRTYGKALALWDCNGGTNQVWDPRHPLNNIL
ncbi:ricin-type beta-trefoil lectin domain protein [Kitasatospora sp. NPDC101801]|uniref:ricin-type beta-trefoil lectin domain protein n=1 Tax=Kitasatospora sp. NPDC101801 TaxID=3364103 RepID=UPI0038191C2E